MGATWPLWSVYEDEIERRGWSDSTVARVKNYLSGYKHYCGGQQPTIFLAAEFLNREIGNGRLSKPAYVHTKTMLDSLMRETGFFHFLGDSYIENTAIPDQKDIFEALWKHKSISGIQAIVVLRLFSNRTINQCISAKVKDYDVENKTFFGKHVIPEPFSFLIEDHIEQILSRGGNKNSFMCPRYNRVTKELDLSKRRSINTFWRSLKRMSSLSGVDIHWLCSIAADSTRRYPRGSIIQYKSRGT